MRQCLLWAGGVTLAVGLLLSCGESESGPGVGAAGAGDDGGTGSALAGNGSEQDGGSSASRGGQAADGGQGPKGAGGAPGSDGGAPGSDGGAPGFPGGAPGVGGVEQSGGAHDAGGHHAGGADGSAAGAGGDFAESAGAGGAGTEAPACDDGKLETQDLYNPLYGCAHLTDDVAGGGDGWLYYDAGFYVDERTGAAWSPLAAGATLEADEATCAALELGGLSGWRLPTIDEVRASFAGGCPATAPTGSCPIHDPTNLSSAEVYTAACASCLGSATSAYCPKNVPFCAWLKTTSPCTDCAGSQNWAYGPSNGNFAAIDASSGITMSCVLPSLPGGVP